MRSLLRFLGLAIVLAGPWAALAQPIETKVETTTETTHTWPDGPLTFSRILAFTWNWTRVGAGEPARYHGKVTRVELTAGGDGAQPVKYDSRTAPATPLPDLPIEIAGYAAWIGGELDIEVDAGGNLTRVVNADTLTGSLLDRLAAPNAPIREQIYNIAGGQFSGAGVQAQVEELLNSNPRLRAGTSSGVPGFPALVETQSAEQKPGLLTTTIQRRRAEAPPILVDLGAAKINLNLSGSGTLQSGESRQELAPFAADRIFNRTLTGSAEVAEKAPSMVELPASWPVTIQITTKVTSQKTPASPH